MEDKIVEFYRRVIFGEEYDKSSATNVDSVFKWCFYNAWSDMARHTLKWNDDSADKDKIKQDICKDFVYDLTNVNWRNLKTKEIRDFISKFQTKMKNSGHFEYTDGEIQKNFTFGQAQKVVNMFFKYLYTFKDELNLQGCTVFGECDCPIDSRNFQRIGQDSKEFCKGQPKIVRSKRYIVDPKNSKKDITWSVLDDKNQYEVIQDRIDSIITNSGKYQNRLDYEFDWR